ncbi:hypothetical protein MtrunA17_Chr4g0005241 [Medicago truncatula]|uniref:Uncharacterized protein n=1 Tax=Medicago truncatula TaxID=3880 RepID=A0A396I789_MEDTR|nr:hypothetical protein MtrunA17_Chr4g0005241 [Medicago truncatula]
MVHIDNSNMYTGWQVNVSQSYSMLCRSKHIASSIYEIKLKHISTKQSISGH